MPVIANETDRKFCLSHGGTGDQTVISKHARMEQKIETRVTRGGGIARVDVNQPKGEMLSKGNRVVFPAVQCGAW